MLCSRSNMFRFECDTKFDLEFSRVENSSTVSAGVVNIVERLSEDSNCDVSKLFVLR